MAPPKADAFADLFQTATGTLLLALSRNSPLNRLAPNGSKPRQNPAVNATWNLDVLSPTPSGSAASSGYASPSVVDESDPFAIFEKPALNAPKMASVANTVHAPQPAHQKPQVAQTTGDFLLDDEFTDAFTPEPKPAPAAAPVPVSTPAAPNKQRHTSRTPELPQRRLEGSRRSKQVLDSDRDGVLAGLVDIGFPVAVSNQAIDAVGADLQACVNHIMGGGQQDVLPQRLGSPNDLGATLQDLSQDIFKKASWFLDKSKKSVIKNISSLQQGGRSSDPMPAWMRNQHKYKDEALERKGEAHEDYGLDEENIDKEEIQRIVRMQRQRERERQKERLESGRSSGRESPVAKPATPIDRTEARPTDSRLAARPAARPTVSSRNSASSVPSRPLSRQNTSSPALDVPRQEPPKAKAPVKPADAEVDLLGLGGPPLSRAERFKQSADTDEVYASPSRRRVRSATPARNATSEPLNAFQQSDYETFKAKGTEAFTNGDFGEALTAYTRCIEALPAKHELRIVITSNIAVTAFKLGDYKVARQNCEEGMGLVGESVDDTAWVVSEKPIKYWYVKLLTRKAETLEMLENFAESLECYMALISKHGVNDKKTMDARRRVDKIVNPPAKRAPVAAKPRKAAVKTENLDRIKKKHSDEKVQEDMKFRLHDQVHARIEEWKKGKEDNLRNLLMTLGDVLPARLGFPFVTTKITINDLMLTKKVKINYLKVISSIHPDKLSKFELEDQMICQAVFIVLNEAWDTFKQQNNIA